MLTMYVISNETDEIVATITGNENDEIEDVFWSEFGPNNFSNSYTDFGTDYAESIQELDVKDFQ